MKSTLITILLTGASLNLARAQFNPVALTPASYTYAIVTPSNTVPPLPACITASVGSGVSEGDHTFFEQGVYARTGAYQYCGVPLHNVIFTDQSNPNRQYQMPASYLVNNGLLVDSGVTSGGFTLNTPATFTNLAFLVTGGNGGCTVNYTVSHLDGVTTETGSFNPGDWFGGSNPAWYCSGRVGTPNGGFDSTTTGSTATAGAVGSNPRIYSQTIKVSSASPVTAISFIYNSGGGHDCFFAMSGSASGGTWSPVGITGFNEELIEPAALPFPITASMDNGTNVSSDAVNGGPGNTWFEQGYYQANTSYGLPPSGSIFASQSNPNHFYQMQNYNVNNATLVDVNHLTANITPANPTNYSAFALLTAGANISGAMTNLCILQHQDGVNETNLFFGYDWYNSSIAPAYISNGRVNMDDRSMNTLGGGNPKLFESYFPLNDVASPVTNILVEFVAASAGNSTTFIMAVSASAGGVAPLVTSGASPATQTWYPTQTANFAVTVSGTAPITNSWLVQQGFDINDNPVYAPLTDGVDANGSTIIGSGTTSLTISNLTLLDGTNYEYIAANVIGAATSAPAMLIINSGTPVAPIIDSQIPTASFGVLTNKDDVTTFSVVIDASSAPPFYYQWYNGATPISGATSSTYPNVDTNTATIYCIITNFVGSATSSPVSITIYSKPPLSPYQSAIFAYNPVAYWPLNETSGNIAFDYAGTNDGIYNGSFTLGEPGLPDTLGIGTNTSVGFDGSTAFVEIPVGNLNITGPVTIIQWVQPPSGADSGFTTPFGHSDSSWRLDVAGGDPHFADAGPDVVSTSAINDGNWHLLVGVYDGSVQSLYVDGQPAGTPLAVSSAPPGSTDDVRIGGAPDYGNRMFSGNIAQCAVIPSALSAAQILAIYNSLDTPPSVSITPANPSTYVGASITLTAATQGTPPFTYQWYYIDDSNNSNNIADATNNSYTLQNAPSSDDGYQFGINAFNSYGSTNASVTLSVVSAPAFLAGDISPLFAEAYVGAPVTYAVNAQGALPIEYQWLVNGVPVAGATNASYTAPALCGTNTYQVTFTNEYSAGAQITSSLATLQGDAYPPIITFNTNGAGWQFNTVGSGGVPTLETNVLELTDGGPGEASSVFYAVPQYVGTFTASFTYQAGGDKGADGVAFILQNYSQGSNSLGGGGGGLGYSGISNSVALEINLYPGNGEIPGIAAGTNGDTYANGGAEYQPAGPVAVNGGDPINVTLNWAHGVLGVTLTDADTLATYSTNYVFGSLAPILNGSDLAYVGFSGGDGGATSIQTISNFEFNSVIPPVRLSVTPLAGNSFMISWPAADPSYELQTSTSLSPASWTAGPTPVTVGGVNQITVNAAGGGASQFYRLVRVVCE